MEFQTWERSGSYSIPFADFLTGIEVISDHGELAILNGLFEGKKIVKTIDEWLDGLDDVIDGHQSDLYVHEPEKLGKEIKLDYDGR